MTDVPSAPMGPIPEDNENSPDRGDIHGTIVNPGPPSLDPGHTNAGNGLGYRRSDASLSRHYSQHFSTAQISVRYWTWFKTNTIDRYKQAPNLNAVDLKHSMHPNTHLPGSIIDEEGTIIWDDLNAVSPGDSKERSVTKNPCINWPLPGPVPSTEGPASDQNPRLASVDVSRENYVFMESRKTRYTED